MKEKKAELESLIITEKDLQHRATVIASLSKNSEGDDYDDDEEADDSKKKRGKNAVAASPASSNVRDDFSVAQGLVNKAIAAEKELSSVKEFTSQLKDSLNTRVTAARSLPVPTSVPTSSSVASALGPIVAYKSPAETVLAELKSVLEYVTDFKTKNDVQNATQQLADLIANCDKERAVVQINYEVLHNHLTNSFMKYLENK